MKAYYQVAINKEQLGAAVRFRQPHLEGSPIVRVMDASSDGESAIIVMECSEEEHKFNLIRPGVMELAEADAIKVAAKYQPKQTIHNIDPRTGKEEKKDIPAFRLDHFIVEHEKQSRGGKAPARSGIDTGRRGALGRGGQAGVVEATAETAAKNVPEKPAKKAPSRRSPKTN